MFLLKNRKIKKSCVSKLIQYTKALRVRTQQHLVGTGGVQGLKTYDQRSSTLQGSREVIYYILCIASVALMLLLVLSQSWLETDKLLYLKGEFEPNLPEIHHQIPDLVNFPGATKRAWVPATFL